MEYIPVLVLLLVGAGLGAVIIGLSALLSPRVKLNVLQNSPFECGVPPAGSTEQRISVRFYLVAILFLLFDVEAIFFYPWAIVFKDYLRVNAFILVEMGIFVGILLLGYFYVVRKGALEWD